MYGQVKRRRLTSQQKFLLFAGVIMPVISITVEATTHMCAEALFDPIPTTWHLLMVVFVPLAHFHVWSTIRRGRAERLTLAGWANALTIGISLFYSFLYLPLMPVAALTILFGIGLLPLAPLLSLVASIVMRHQLSQLGSTAPKKSLAVTKRGVMIGLATVIALIGMIELPATLTRYGLHMAASDIPERRAEGIRFLRTYGNRNYLLLNCYYRSGWPTDFLGYWFSLREYVSPSEARGIYYRVTGETFDTSIPPRRVGANLLPEDELDFDRDQGGMTVGGKLRGLSLASSTLDASADPAGGVAYMQWTMLFRNESDLQREARAEVQLPPGAVVSRLTLWVNGEEREAAFAGTRKVREAYQSIVNQRRDPVLVTTAGRDRILVQCFPVPPSGGTMKIRIGITMPLLLEDYYVAQLLLPHFNHRNFRIPDNVNHSVWIESKTALGSENPAFYADQPRPEVYALRGTVNDEQLANRKASIQLDRSYFTTKVWGRNPFEGSGHIIEQTIVERKPKYLTRIVFVVDTSEAMLAFADQIQMALSALPRDFDVKTVFADSTGRFEMYSRGGVASGRDQTAIELNRAEFGGGADNAPALVKAWELAAEKPGHNVIVWIHSPQLVELGSVDDLRQRWERRPYGPVLYSVQTRPGSDVLEQKLDGIQEVKTVPRVNTLRVDLEKLFAQLLGEKPSYEFVRTSKKVEEYPDSFSTQTSDHLVRLWARDEVTRILSDARIVTTQEEELREAATALAVRYQLVTPVSGAVVLETAEQYKAAGLQPVDEGTVPTIPEPEMVILLLIMAMFLLWVGYQKYRRSRNGKCVI